MNSKCLLGGSRINTYHVDVRERPKKSLNALVLSGGGARGAYEAGVMQYLNEAILGKSGVFENFDIYSGSSVGAINTCYLVSAAHLSPEERSKKILETWSHLTQEQIYLRDATAFMGFVMSTLKGVTVNMFRNQQNFTPNKNHFNGFFDTKPLPKFLTSIIDFSQLNLNISKGPVSAICLTATNMQTDAMELFVHKKRGIQYTGRYPINEVVIEVEHPRASAAIPIAFPPIKVGEQFYMDGGLRLNTPMSPAIQLGADKILIVGLHSQEERLHVYQKHRAKNYTPTLGDIMGKVLNSIFLDRVEYDLEQLGRINRVIGWGKERYGDDFVLQINDMIRKKNERGDIASRGLKELKVLSIFPSRDLRDVFSEAISDKQEYAKHFGAIEKMMLKILDIDLIQGRDFLSYLMFIPSYLQKLLELGYQDAKSQHKEITEFLNPKL